MGDGYDRFDNEGGGGGSFVIGLLTGTVLGAGLGMLFAPKAGSELRGQLSEQAGKVANQASEQYRRASETASDLADRGREMHRQGARRHVTRGADEAQRYVRDGDQLHAGTPSTASAGSSSFGSSSYRNPPRTVDSRAARSTGANRAMTRAPLRAASPTWCSSRPARPPPTPCSPTRKDAASRGGWLRTWLGASVPVYLLAEAGARMGGGRGGARWR